MATKNFFDLLGDDENEDPAQVVVRANSVAADAKPAAAAAAKKPAAAAAKLPTKPAPPSEAGTCSRLLLCGGARPCIGFLFVLGRCSIGLGVRTWVRFCESGLVLRLSGEWWCA